MDQCEITKNGASGPIVNCINYTMCLSIEVKKARLRLAGHMERMPDSRMVQHVFRGHPHGRRLPGRPRKRWLDDVEEDLRKLRVRDWRQQASDRPEWRRVVEQAKELHGL